MRQLMMSALLLISAGIAGDAIAQSITRTPTPGLPISQSIHIPAGSERLLLSGQVPPPLVEGRASTVEDFGGTRVQTAAILRNIAAILDARGFGLKDVVRMQAFLVGDPANGGVLDLDAFNAAYSEVFGTATQPNRPVRSLFQVSRLARPGWLVEIEVEAAKAAD